CKSIKSGLCYIAPARVVFSMPTGRRWLRVLPSPGTAVHPACGRCSERREALSIGRRGHRWAYVKCARYIKKPLFGRPENGLVNVKISLAVRQDKLHKIHALGILQKRLILRLTPKTRSVQQIVRHQDHVNLPVPPKGVEGNVS